MIVETKPLDRRVRRTKKMLKHSFVQLLEQKPYDRISVKDIVERADYNRATFYNHYKYKEELVDDIVDELVLGLITFSKDNIYFNNYLQSTKGYKITVITRIIFDYVEENRDFFKLWKFSEAIPGLYERFLHAVIMLLKEVCQRSRRDKIELNDELFATFYAY